MAKYELSIYGANDEVVKKYEANRCTWAVFVQAADLQEQMQGKPATEQLKSVNEILKAVFIGLTDEELMNADGEEVLNTFMQVVQGGQQIKNGNGKNV